MPSRTWKFSAVVACLLLALGARAEAQVCGDADGNGSVTVSDGVQALRAAASLPSSCDGNTNCDIDGNGSVSVTDGVNVLRKAAQLPITEACGGGVDQQIESLLRTTIPTASFFGSLTKLIPPGGGAGIADEPCTNVDGTFTFDPELNEYDFADCDFGGFNFDGFITINADTLEIELDVTDLATDEFFSFSAVLTGVQSGDNFVISGPLEVDSDIGFFAVTFEEVTTDSTGNTISGSLLFDASDSDIEGVVGVRVGFVPGNVVPVEVVFDDQTSTHFNFDTQSGELTPAASN